MGYEYDEEGNKVWVDDPTFQPSPLAEPPGSYSDFAGEKYTNPLIAGYGGRTVIMKPGEEPINEWGHKVSPEYVKDIEDVFTSDNPDETATRKIAARLPPNQPSDNELNYFKELQKFRKVAQQQIGIDPEAIFKKTFSESIDRTMSNYNTASRALLQPKDTAKIKQDAFTAATHEKEKALAQLNHEMGIADQAFKIGWDEKEKHRLEARKAPTDDQRLERELTVTLGRKPTDAEFNAKKQERAVELASAKASALTGEKDKAIDVLGLAKAVGDGQDAPIAIKGSMGNPLAAKVKSAVLKNYPKFDFNMADANYKWKQSATNQRTINFVGGSLPRLGALDDQLKQMPNVEINTINKVMAAVSKEFGKPEFTNYEANRNAIVQEINTALSGTSQASDLRIKIELENLKSSRSPAQIRGAIENLRMALEARLDVDLAPLYPIDVVRGEKTIEQYKQELYKKYRGDYKPHFGQQGGGTPVSSNTNFDRLKKQNPNKSDAEVRAYMQFKGY